MAAPQLQMSEFQEGRSLLHQPVAPIPDDLRAFIEAGRGQVAVGQPPGGLDRELLVHGPDLGEADVGFGAPGRPGALLGAVEGFAVIPVEPGVVVEAVRRGAGQVAPEGQQEAIQLRHHLGEAPGRGGRGGLVRRGLT